MLHAVMSDESTLVFAGFAAFLDPPKTIAGPALLAMEASGVAVKILTGDNERVTRHVCEQLDIRITGLLTGGEISALPDSSQRSPVSHGWFVESIATQILIIFVIRTQRNPLRSHPNRCLVWVSLGVLASAIALPFSPMAPSLGFTPLPVTFLGLLALLFVHRGRNQAVVLPLAATPLGVAVEGNPFPMPNMHWIESYQRPCTRLQETCAYWGMVA